jgi:RimJ/RimL family protein N-acetyltransferase
MLISSFETVAEWVAERAGCSIPNYGAGLGMLNKAGDLVAGVMYENYTGASVTATIAINKGTIISKDFMRVIFDYPFQQLGVKKLFAMIAASNQSSIDFVTRCGFIEETRVKDYYESGDAIVFACTPESCRWLTMH